MTTTLNSSLLTVAWKTTTGPFYGNLAKHLKSTSRFRQNFSTPLQQTTEYHQLSTPHTNHRRLPNKNLHTVHFKTT